MEAFVWHIRIDLTPWRSCQDFAAAYRFAFILDIHTRNIGKYSKYTNYTYFVNWSTDNAACY